jgi:phosphohistidine phosphatase
VKRLLLMRHAKSDWTDAVLEDHDRPLNDRGRRDAPRMGRLLAAEGLVPDLVVCSTAVRARQTLEGLAAGGGLGEAAVVHEASLYLASPGTILAVARAAVGDAGGEPERVLLIGHNPGMEELASRLAGRFVRFPTATVAVCDLATIDWADLDAGRGVARVTAVRAFRPKELPAESGGG